VRLALRCERSALRVFEGTTGDDGVLEFEDVPTGSLSVVSDASPTVVATGLRVTPGEATVGHVILDGGEAVLRGEVLDAHEDPLGGAQVHLVSAHEEAGVTSRTVRTTWTDRWGEFAIVGIGEGSHEVRVAARGHRERVVPWQVRDGPLRLRCEAEP
jgi:hypothetical protein